MRAEATAIAVTTPISPAPDPTPAEVASASDVPGVETPLPQAHPGLPFRRLATIFVAAFALCVLAYLVVAVPGKWFAAASTQSFGPKELQVTKGASRIAGEELHVRPADASGIVVVSVATTLRSTDYAAIEWIAIDVPEDIDVSLIFRTDVKPEQLNSIPLTVISGRLLPVVTNRHPAWIGRIEGLALAMKGPIAEPVRIRGVIAKPLSAAQVLSDRAREWLTFEGWHGTSINTVTGGADLQDLPLPLLLACAVALATLVVAAVRRFRPSAFPAPTFAALVAFVLAAWMLLDLRWTYNLVRQVDATAERFAGKSFIDKRLAVEDGPLFAFVQKAKEAMPQAPARVIVGADSHYFRGRAAYHLYPHNVLFHPTSSALPDRAYFRSGDWFLVYLRKGVQFDAAQGKLRWDNNEPVDAELKLAGRGAALFRIR